jgi:sigma-B regulation protein RsbU (phosphoserine phosphatase)
MQTGHSMPSRAVVTAPNGSRKSVELSGQQLSLGRSIDNDLSFPEDSGLSRHHMLIEKVAGEWCVRDLGSKNGTLLNDEKVAGSVPLKEGDRIVASRVVLVLNGPEETLPAGTVIFDTLAVGDKPPTHTVTLGELIPKGEGAREPRPGVPGKEWTDPVTVLVRAGRELMARKGLPRLYQDALNLCMEAVGATRGVLMLQEGGSLKALASRGEEFLISTAVRDRVLNGRSSLLISDAMMDDALRMRQSIVRQKVHSLMAVPLQTEDQVLGLIYVDSPHLWRQFNPQDLNLLTVMANVAALRIERERLAVIEEQRRILEIELERAAEIQRQILPGRSPSVAGLELAGYNAPCQTVGGDYYDFLKRTDGKVLVAVGDVAGKGMSAALLMVNLQARVQMLAEHHTGPAEMVSHLNRAMNVACPDNRFVTFFLCQIDPSAGEFAYCNAGHNPPFIVDAAGGVQWLEGGGPVLGIFPDLTYEQRVARLKPGELIVVYSDGVTEMRNPQGEEFGEDRLLEVVRANRHLGPEELVDTVNRTLDQFAEDAAPPDDVTLVLARWTGPPRAAAPPG